MRLRDIIGVDNIQFGADYPHDEGTFPMSRQVAEEVLAGCTDEEKQKDSLGQRSPDVRHQLD